MFRQDGSCPALLEDLCPGFPYGAVTRYGSPFQTLPVPKTEATGLVRVRSPLLAESRLMSFPPATEMFQFTGFASLAYEFSQGYPFGWVAPFGDPGINDRSHLPRAFRSVPRPSSPLSAKASTRCPSFALLAPHPTAKIILAVKARQTLLSEDTTGSHRQPARHTSLPAAHGLPPRSHNSLLHHVPSTTAPRRLSGGKFCFLPRSFGAPDTRAFGVCEANACRRDRPALPRDESFAFIGGGGFRRNGVSPVAHQSCSAALVEVNGLEPSTSCLQSRRSPS